MVDTLKQERTLRALITFADTLVADYDVVELLQTLVDSCRDLLGATASGVLLADPAGALEVVASTSEASRLVELMQLSAHAGPCIESYRSGRIISVPDIATVPEDWSAFRDEALAHGFVAVDAIPLRLRQTTIGTLNLLRDIGGELVEEDRSAAQAFADVATIGILQERALRHSELVNNQLQVALNSRVIIEQAKGVIAYTHNIPIDDAFAVLRSFARSRQERLSDVAAAVVDRTLTIPHP